jgi:hypothetical protein
MPRKTSPKPPARKRKPKAARVAAVAAALIEGKSQADAARDAGVSRQAVGKIAGEADQLICGLVREYYPRLQSTFLRVLQVLDDALVADRVERSTTVTLIDGPEGKKKITETVPLNLGPDHYARLTASKRYLELLTAGRPTPKAIDAASERRLPTWQELCALVDPTSNAATSGSTDA